MVTPSIFTDFTSILYLEVSEAVEIEQYFSSW